MVFNNFGFVVISSTLFSSTTLYPPNYAIARTICIGLNSKVLPNPAVVPQAWRTKGMTKELGEDNIAYTKGFWNKMSEALFLRLLNLYFQISTFEGRLPDKCNTIVWKAL